ncbi:MAG: PilZ domain-containing protein [Hyphomicrobium zavarzinii]|uniref:PilZ domain-containing protein n=1 Tax=Hyphomicrobium zavarzinii TaxID=48292 RepID=UPI001A49321A|nr:PilZ domain-containing protein [Hyphomicrobium zavarzinii]MBL8846369.1 PilZ domain-containing protein [Hyphomicrobium zavarzinii]
MSPSSASTVRASIRFDTRIVPDRRRHKRYALALLGRFMRANKQEFPCRLNDISVGGAAIMAPVEVEIGERIVVYFDEIGGLEGVVVRTFEGGFAIALKATQHKREKLAAQITWLVNKDDLGGTFGRRHKRFEVVNKTSTLRLSDGQSVDCRVLDVSLSGASIQTDARPPIGDEVIFGKLRCRVMRYHDRGIGVQFLDIPDPEALRRYFG